jgi:putative ABC transport system permease protein
LFTSTYDAAKAADARFTVGSDVRVAPSVVVAQPHPPSYGDQLRVAGVVGVSPVVYRIENSILINGLKEDRKNLAAIDPGSFQRVAAVSDRFFVGTRAGAAMAALQRDGHAVLVQQQSAEDLDVGVGDPVKILLARGTKRQTIENFRVAAIYRDFPGFPDGTDIVANLHTYQAAIKSDATDFFLVRTHDPGPRTLSAVTAALRSGPGSRERLNIDTTSTALNKDESSLTGVNVHGLVRMDSLYTLLMTAASVGVFVFGLMLSRRREYVALRARGLRTGGLQSLVLGEAALVAVCGLVAGGLVGAGMAYLMVRVLRPLFILAPHLTVSPAQLLLIGGLAMVAALVCALAATAILRRLKPTEILREN